jgi:hypothetical protein
MDGWIDRSIVNTFIPFVIRESAAHRARRIRIPEMCFRNVCVHVSSMFKFDSLGGGDLPGRHGHPRDMLPGPAAQAPLTFTAPSQGRSWASTDTKFWRPPRHHHMCGQQQACPCCFVTFVRAVLRGAEMRGKYSFTCVAIIHHRATAVSHGGCEWYEFTCECASFGGHLAVLQRAMEHDGPRDANDCALVADAHGHVEVARWARAQFAL